MSPFFQLDKSHAIMQFLLNVIVLPVIVGIAVGSITGRIKPYVFKLTLITMSIVSIIFLVFNLITLQNQSLPLLAIILTGISIVIMNTLAVISYKIVRKIVVRKKYSIMYRCYMMLKLIGLLIGGSIYEKNNFNATIMYTNPLTHLH